MKAVYFMKMLKIHGVIFILILLLFGCRSFPKIKAQQIDNNCKKVIELEIVYFMEPVDVSRIQELLAFLEIDSGIEANCPIGYGGYYAYEHDSLFHSDIAAWKAYYKCK